MRRSICTIFACLLGFILNAQEANDDVGPHHRVRSTIEQVLRPDGSVAFETNVVVQLEAGLNRLVNGQWVEAHESLEIIGETVVARHTAHRVIWAANANSRGAVDVELPDGTRLVSNCLGLSYYDAASGKSVLIAELKDSIAEVHPPDMVLYADAFDDVDGDLLYLSRKGRFEQLVVLHAKPPAPEDFGLDPATTRLEIMTEFLNPPEPLKSPRVLRLETDARVRAAMVEPDLVDEELDFGSMYMGAGQAFLPAGEPWRMEAASAIPVTKRWQMTSEGRTVLFEAVEHQSLAPLLATLSPPAGGPSVANHRLPSTNRTLPARRLAAKGSTPIHMASVSRVRSGLVLDYPLSTPLTNYVFRGDTTYYLTGAMNCVGTNTVFEAGAVIKFAPTNNAHLDLASSNITWLGTAYRPVIVTASDDSSVGSIATTNSLNGYYGTTALNFLNPLTNVTVSHVRVAHAKGAMAFSQGNGHTVSHAQFVNCGKGLILSGADVRLRNALMANVSTNFDLTTSIARVEHLTVNTAARLNNAGVLYLTNSLLVSLYATNGWSGESNVFLDSAAGVFASVGAGSHYLVSGSPYRNVGITAINSDLQMDLKTMTTVAPTALTSTITTATTLGPSVARDTDTPDLGYHYCPLDYVSTLLTVTNTTLTFSNGVAIGFYGPYWIWPREGSAIMSEGTPSRLNHLAPLLHVQEQPLSTYASANPVGLYPAANATNAPTATLRFTSIDSMTGYPVLQSVDSRFSTLDVRHCSFGSGGFYSELDTTNVAVNLVNNLFERQSVQFLGTFSLTAYNNLVRNGEFWILNYATNMAVVVKDNAFENTSAGSSYPVTHGYNAYINASWRFEPTNVNDKVLSSFTYSTGSLGRFYHSSTNLLNVGSRGVADAGLYHFTVVNSTNKDTSTVDIGYHYVATDGSGNPLDFDADGIPDYLEDKDGDNVLDASESSWTNSNSGISGAAGLQVFTPLK